jgi:hypothetical protein
LSREAQIFFPELNIRLYDKNSESDYFFFPPPKSECFFQQHWESELFLVKNHNPPLQDKWSFPKADTFNPNKYSRSSRLHPGRYDTDRKRIHVGQQIQL